MRTLLAAIAALSFLTFGCMVAAELPYREGDMSGYNTGGKEPKNGGYGGGSGSGKSTGTGGGNKDKDKKSAGSLAAGGGGVVKAGDGGKSTISGKQDQGGGKPYTPGAVPNFPDANAAAVVDMLSSAIPGVGTGNSVYKGAKAMLGEDATFGPFGDMMGAETGVQAGWQPDRYYGEDSTGGVGGSGGATNDSDGPMLTPVNRAVVGDSSTPGAAAISGDFSDVTLQDVPQVLRRKNGRLSASSMMATGM